MHSQSKIYILMKYLNKCLKSTLRGSKTNRTCLCFDRQRGEKRAWQMSKAPVESHAVPQAASAAGKRGQTGDSVSLEEGMSEASSLRTTF